MTNHEKILALNALWYPLITCDQHKNRDVHFYIITDFHHGEKVSYTVEHKGYIVYNYENSEWDTQEEAELELIRLLSESILGEVSWYLDHYGDSNWDQHPKYDKDDLEEIITRVMLITKD
jgi:hypothetical protein